MRTLMETAVLDGAGFAVGPCFAALLLLLVVPLIGLPRGAAMERAR